VMSTADLALLTRAMVEVVSALPLPRASHPR